MRYICKKLKYNNEEDFFMELKKIGVAAMKECVEGDWVPYCEY